MSATGIKSKLRRLARPSAGATLTTSLLGEEVDADADAYGNETRILRGKNAAFQIPRHRDKRLWIRWPAQLWRVTGQRFVPQGQNLEFRPPTHWWSRWLSYAWRMFIRSGGYDSLLEPLRQSYLNLLLVFLPLALVAVLRPLHPNVIVIFDFLAIIPLSGLVHFACEDLSAHLNPTFGNIFAAFSDNLVELVVGIVALTKGERQLALLSLIGSVMCYSLLIMGSCFFASGIRYRMLYFNSFAAQSIVSLNFFAACCLFIPSTLYMLIEAGHVTNGDTILLVTSLGNSVICLILYTLNLLFKFRTHSDAYDFESSDEDISTDGAVLSLGPIAAAIWLAVSLMCVTLCTVSLVSNIPASMWRANNSFLGFVLFPFLGNVPDFLSAVVVALKQEIDITIHVTFESSTQLLLFNLPVLVVLGWLLNKPLILSLDLFEIGTVFFSVFVIRYMVGTGQMNYLSGATCIALYAIIALAAFLNTSGSMPA